MREGPAGTQYLKAVFINIIYVKKTFLFNES